MTAFQQLALFPCGGICNICINNIFIVTYCKPRNAATGCNVVFSTLQFSKCFFSYLGKSSPFVNLPTEFNATLGEDVKLLCRVRRGDSSDTSWTRNGTTLKRSDKYRIKPKKYLRITKVQKSDAGEYICWAKKGADKRSRPIKLNVKGRKCEMVMSQ